MIRFLFRSPLLRILLFLLLGFTSATDATPRKDYWLFQEYLAQNPNQIALSKQFQNQVQQPSAALKFRQQKPVRIVVIYPGNQVSDYWRRSLDVLEKRLRELQINFELTPFFSRPSLQADLQEVQFRKALKMAPDYLVVTLDSNRHRRMIERALAKGATKLIVQNMTTPIKAWSTNPPLLYVGFDHHQGTALLSDAIFARHNPDRTDFSVLFREQGYVSDARGKGFINHLNAKNSPPLSQFYTHSDRKSARIAALDALDRNPEVDFFYACSTDVAFGALDALREKGRLQNVKVNGWGGGGAELASIRAGEMDLTVMRINDDNGIAMAEAIKNDLEGVPVPQVFSGRFVIVTQDTPALKLDELRRQAFQYSGVGEEAQ
ncbi:MAG: substrate-binding domain-containing protein [Motiliproteus sp.]